MLLGRIDQQKSGEKHKKGACGNEMCGSEVLFCGVFVFTPRLRVTLITGSFALFNASLTGHTPAVIGTSSVFISAALM